MKKENVKNMILHILCSSSEKVLLDNERQVPINTKLHLHSARAMKIQKASFPAGQAKLVRIAGVICTVMMSLS